MLTFETQEVARIVQAYRSRIVRAYCRGRFIILRQRFLQEVGQYLPDQGEVMDIGCGFGLFSLYYAMKNPGLVINGIDLNETRIGMARDAAAALGVRNVHYEVGNAASLDLQAGLDTAYMLDIVHHLPSDRVRPLLTSVFENLAPGGRLLIKDVNTTPRWKRWFTHVLDKAMDIRTPVSYWSQASLVELLQAIGFRVYTHEMVDILPYPHVLYICDKPEPGSRQA